MIKKWKNTRLVIKSKSDLMATYARIRNDYHVLDQLIRDVRYLKRSSVDPLDTKYRSRIGSYFSNQALQMKYQIKFRHMDVKNSVLKQLHVIHNKAEQLVRENITVQAIPPLDIIKYENILERFIFTPTGRKEQRYCIGMHKLPFAEEDYSISFAIMPANHTQVLHSHTVPEYTFVECRTNGIFKHHLQKKLIAAHKYDLIHFGPLTVHTLQNPNAVPCRNMTVKKPMGVLDWRPYINLEDTGHAHADIIKAKRKSSRRKQIDRLIFNIRDEVHNYTIEILTLNKKLVFDNVYDSDKYLYVLKGSFSISTKGINKEAAENDYIVIDKNTNFRINTKTKTTLYIVHVNK